MAKNKAKVYAVARGYSTGIFHNWEDCKAATERFPKQLYKAFPTMVKAEAWLKINKPAQSPAQPPSAKNPTPARPTPQSSHTPDTRKLEAKRAALQARKRSHDAEAEELKRLEAELDNEELGLLGVKVRKQLSTQSPSSNPPASSPIGTDFAIREMQSQSLSFGKGLGSHEQGETSPVKSDWDNVSVDANGLGYEPPESPQKENPKTLFTSPQPGASTHVNKSTTQLSEDQQHAIKFVDEGRNVFVTGCAGTGKSLAIQHILLTLREKFKILGLGKEVLAVCASTGVAALQLGGGTLHSFAGAGVPKKMEDFKKMWKKKKEWRALRALVLDEVSMLPASLLDEFDKEVRQIRGNTEQCFGGIQLIFVGDFAQLGPVLKPANIDTPFKKADGFVESGLAFEGTMWTDANFEMVELKKSYRQPEPMFLNALNDIRMGFGDTSNVRWLVEKCSVRSGGAGGSSGDEEVKPTKLYPKNVDVNEINSAELAKLIDGEKHRYTAEDSAKPERGWKEEWLIGELEKNCMAPDVLDLKIGAEVMLIKNMPNEGLVNGSRGKVTEFRQDYGPHGVKAGDNAEYPVVKFGSGFGNSMNMLVKEMSFEMEILGKGTSTRKQIPLKLAWAVTIHKSQGLSIDLLEVEIESCFAKGQAYTALSRARTTNGLTILGKFDPDCVQCEDKVREFYGFPRKPEGGESTQTTTIPIPLLSPTAHDPTRTQSQPSAGTDAALGSAFSSSNINISNQDEKIVKTPKTPMVKNPYL